MRVLVCGGRDFDDDDLLRLSLFKIIRQRGGFDDVSIIHGGARGADNLADIYAQAMGIPVMEFKADWKAHGRAAGPIRNQQMIDEGKPDLVVAFPGGRGTADMVRRAKAAGIEVIECPRPAYAQSETT